MFSSKISQWCLVHRSSVLRVPHAIKSLKHIHSKGLSTIHLSCQQCHLTNMAVSSIPTTKGNHRLWLHLPRLSRALQSQHSGSALMQSQPHSIAFKNLNKIPASTRTNTHSHMNTHKCVPSIQCLKIQSHIQPTWNRAEHLLPPTHQQLCVHQEHIEERVEI